METKYTTGLSQFLLAVLWGIAFVAVAVLSLNMVIILGIATIVLILRHLSDWLIYILGVIVGIVLATLLGVALPDYALLVVIFGSVLF
jgi:hypothetical protein